MKKASPFLVIAAVSVFLAISDQALGAYCIASGGCDEYIYGVQVGSINRTATPCSQYADYTATDATVMEPGIGYAIDVITAIGGNPYTGYDGDECKIWVDWNQDEDFYDPNELVYSQEGFGLFSTTISPPPDALPGNTRMRVRLWWTGSGSSVSPCGGSDYGEVEDYTITVVGNDSGKITGYKFNDLNGDGAWDQDEPGMEGCQVYLDLNDNGQLDLGEPNTVTGNDPDGYYEFNELIPGNYVVAEIANCQWRPTAPSIQLYDQFVLSNHRDMVFDTQREILYISTSDGNIERYDLKSKMILSPFNVGTYLRGMDITPDFNTIYVTESQTNGGQGFLHKVDPDTGATTDIPYTLTSGEVGSWDINLGSHNKGLMTTEFAGSGTVPLREFDTTTDSFTIRTGLPYYSGFTKNSVRGDSRLFRSADRSLIFLVAGDTSAPYLVTYDAASGTFPNWDEESSYMYHRPIGVNRDGTLIAYEMYTDPITIVDGTFSFNKSIDLGDGGFGFDTQRDVLYIANSDTDQIVALHTDSWNELHRVNIGLDILSYNLSFSFRRGKMAVDPQGRYLALTNDTGIVIFRIGGTHELILGEGEQIDNINFGNQKNIPGDFDGDRDVDAIDLTTLGESWLTSQACIDIAPEGGDGIINLPDYAAMSANWMTGI